MNTYITVANQSLKNLAVQLYGNVDAVQELISLNTFAGNMDQPGTYKTDEVDIAYSVKKDKSIVYDENSALVNKAILQRLHGGKWITRDGIIITTGYDITSSDVFDDTFSNEFA